MAKKELDTRTRILVEALRLLEENLGKGVRMGDIAKAAGVSRQAIYLHFESQTDLMVATVQYGDVINGASDLAEPWRNAGGVNKLDTWIEFWGNYLPKIYGVAKALMLARETNEGAAAAWEDRMSDVRRSCQKTIQELSAHQLLAEDWNVKNATELLWTMLSVPTWEQLTMTCGWSTKRYVKHMQIATRRTFLVNPNA